LSLLVSNDITAATVEATIRNAAGDLLQDFRLFDVYKGAELPADKKSVAVGLEIGNNSKTLTDSEIDEVISKVLESLNKQLNAHLRE